MSFQFERDDPSRNPLFKRNEFFSKFNPFIEIIVIWSNTTFKVRIPNTIWGNNLLELIQNPRIPRMDKLAVMFEIEARELKCSYLQPKEFVEGYRELIHITSKCKELKN